MNDPAPPARSSPRAIATAIRYLSIAIGCACLLLAAICFTLACQVFIETGVLAQSYAMVSLIGAVLGWLALVLGRVRTSAVARSSGHLPPSS